MTRERWRELALAGHRHDELTARGALAEHDPVARELALGALQRMGALTDHDLTVAFADEHPAVRRRAALLAATHGEVSLLPLLDDDDVTVVEAAAWSCGEHDVVTDPVVHRLIDLAGAAADPLVREAAIAALGAIGDERGLPAILAGCRDKPAIRRRAVLALAPFDGDDVEQALESALADRDWQVRQAAEDLRREET